MHEHDDQGTGKGDGRAISTDPRPLYQPSSTSPDESPRQGTHAERLLVDWQPFKNKKIKIKNYEQRLFHERLENGSRG